MRPNLTLPSSVEERISGWVRIQERRAADMAKPERPCVTISRQFGCEGFALSLRLQQLFEQATGEPWNVFDKVLIEKMAQEEEVSLRMLSSLEDPARYLEHFGFHPRGAFTSDEAFARMAAAVVHFAREGNAVIVGRGGAILCHKLENCFHFRLEAGLAWRVAGLAGRMGISPREAADLERAQSRLREQFIREYLGADLADSSRYDAVFNNERHGVEEIAAAILAFIRRGWRGGGFRPGRSTS
jgi:cytidylate kinase